MILGRLGTDKKDLLVIALTGENVARLAAGEPILKTDMGQLGLEVDLLITYGKDDAEIMDQMAQLKNAGKK